MHFDIYLTRQTTNRLNRETTRKNIKYIAEAITRNESLGLTVKLPGTPEPTLTHDGEGESWFYQVRLRVTHKGTHPPDTLKRQFDRVLERARKRALSKGWSIGDAPQDIPIEPTYGAVGRTPFLLPELSDEVIDRHFSDIYERDAHLRVIHGAVRTSVESKGEVLSHVLLYGQPGACKTVLCERLKAWYEEKEREEGPQRVVFVDGTTMSKAGLERYLIGLAGRDALPDVLVVDELEKQPMDNLLALNNVMGSGVLTRLNAHTENLRLPARFTVIGICNDEKALQDFRNGALWSRFGHRLYCARPSRPIAALILEGIATRMGLRDNARALAQAALAFGWDELGQRDIRELKGHLDGRERLLSGEWAQDLLSIRRSQQGENP